MFNLMAMAGICVSVITTIIAILNNGSFFAVLVNIIVGIISIALLTYAYRSGKYQRCYIITIVIIFLMLFPMLYFTGGGSEGSMPYYFIFAVLFTVFMIEGKIALVIAAIEVVVYFSLMLVEFNYPELVTFFPDLEATMLDRTTGLVIVCVSLGLTLFLHFSIYNKQQHELEDAREEAVGLSETKSAFLANMSHEIRTPINVIVGMNEMVLRNSQNEEVVEYALKIQNASQMLLVLVSNILDVTRIESGKLQISNDAYRTAGLIQELYEVGSESARKKGLAFDVKLRENIPSMLVGDVSRIKQIVVNFLSNATKYTNAGSVVMDFYKKKSTKEGWLTLCISVTDTGSGIHQEDFKSIFNAFERVSPSSNQNQNIEGTGLGLTIARELAEQMGGQIFVKSKYGEGSCFWVEIPQEIADDTLIDNWKTDGKNENSGPEVCYVAPEARILVVDDNLDNLQTVKSLLKRMMVRVDLAQSGYSCLEMVKNAEYDVILMDYMMPDMDGIETYKQILQEIPGFSTPIIALTANAIFGTEEKLLAAGFAAYLTKPVPGKMLERTIVSWLRPDMVSAYTIQPCNWLDDEQKKQLEEDLDACGVTLNDGLSNANHDFMLMASMADIFVRNYPTTRERFEKALSSRENEPLDFEMLRHEAHSLKSNAGFVGAQALSRLSNHVEKACESKDSGYVMKAIPLLYLMWKRVEIGLASFSQKVSQFQQNSQVEAASQGFSVNVLALHLKQGVRRGAVRQLDCLIAARGANCPTAVIEARSALEALDFDKAQKLLEEAGILE